MTIVDLILLLIFCAIFSVIAVLIGNWFEYKGFNLIYNIISKSISSIIRFFIPKKAD